jgi:hypothetical protein
MGEGKKVHWTVASARQSFPTVLDLSAREPQEIYRRGRLVARVISADDSAPNRYSRPTLAETIAEIQRICADADYTLDVGSRTTRQNAFLDVLEAEKRRKPSLRAKRKQPKRRRQPNARRPRPSAPGAKRAPATSTKKSRGAKAR